MNQDEKNIITLLVIGAFIGLGKLLVSHEQLTTRLIIGRTILGGATSTVSGIILMRIPDINQTALIGLACAFGILGAQFIEVWLQRQFGAGK